MTNDGGYGRMNCSECIKQDVCRYNGFEGDEEKPFECKHFVDISRFVKLPCKIGDDLFVIIGGKIVKDRCEGLDVLQDKKGWFVRIRLERNNQYFVGTWNEDVFATREEAEKKLEKKETISEYNRITKGGNPLYE